MTDQIVNAADIEKVPEILRRAMAGEHVLVVCRAWFDARAKSQVFWTTHCRDPRNEYRTFFEGISFKENSIQIACVTGGLIEWGYVETGSGRRLDDFHHVIIDGPK